MPIARRGNSYQVAITRGGRRIRKTFKDHASALRYEASVVDRIDRGQQVEEAAETATGGTTLGQLLDLTIARHWRGTSNEDMAVANAQACLSVLGADTDVAAITTRHVDKCVEAFAAKGNSPATINRKLASLGKMLKVAKARGLLTRDVAIERKRESQGRLRWYTHEEEARILKAAEWFDPRLSVLVTFLLDTGARIGEALALRWVDVDATYARFHQTKNGRSRAVPLTERTKAGLETIRDSGSELVFGSFWDDRHAVGRLWDRVAQKAELKGDDAVLHVLRHTCASRLVQGGVAIQIVQQWLGHRTLTMTLRYAHLAPVNILAAVAVLNRGPAQ